MKSSLITNTECEDIYNRRSVAIKGSMSSSRVYEEPRNNEEVRVVSFGPISTYFEKATLPSELPNTSRKVARIGLGASHVVFLFVGTETAI